MSLTETPPAKRMQRDDVALTPEEARIYERFSVEQVQQAVQSRPINVMDEVQAVVKNA